MNDALSFEEGAIEPDYSFLKQWAGAPFEQHQKRRPSVTDSEVSDSSSEGSSVGSSQGSNDSDLTAATSVSPDFIDRFGPSSVADIFIADDEHDYLKDRIPTAPLTSPERRCSARGQQPNRLEIQDGAECLSSDSIDAQFLMHLNAVVQKARNSDSLDLPQWSAIKKPHTETQSDEGREQRPRAIHQLRTAPPPCLRGQVHARSGDNPSAHAGPQPGLHGTLFKLEQDKRNSGAHETRYIGPDVTKPNPRRTKPQGLRPPPTLQRQEQRRLSYVDGLVDITMKIVSRIWPSSCRPVQLTADMSREQQTKSNPVICLRYFIEEVLKRSRTSHSTLQVALFYCYKLGRSGRIPTAESSRQAGADMSLRFLHCGRRMFLCSLILASKFIQDRNYSTRAWSKISSLPIAEINHCETAMLRALDYRIFIKAETFVQWARQTTICVDQSRMSGDCSLNALDVIVDIDLSSAMSFPLRPIAEVTSFSGRPKDAVIAHETSDASSAPSKVPTQSTEPSLATIGFGASYSSEIPPIPRAPQLSNASSPASSPDSESGHPSTAAGSIIHWNTDHPTAGGSHPHSTENRLQNGLLTPAPTSPGSAYEDGYHQTAAPTHTLQFSPRSRATDARAWSEIEQAKLRAVLASETPTPTLSSTETPLPQGLYQEQESYLEEHSWIEDAEDDLERQLEKKRGNRKQRQPAASSMQRKRSIGKCAGNGARHQSGRADKKPCCRK